MTFILFFAKIAKHFLYQKTAKFLQTNFIQLIDFETNRLFY